MATIQKRAGPNGKPAYRVQVRIKGFAPETATFARLTDAREWASRTESDMKVGRYFGQSKRHTFNELADQYQPQAKDAVRLDYWRVVFGADTLDTITASRIAKERDRLLTDDTQNWATPARTRFSGLGGLSRVSDRHDLERPFGAHEP